MKKLNEEITKAARSAEVLERFRNDGTVAVGSTPAEFAEFIRKEQARSCSSAWRKDSKTGL